MSHHTLGRRIGLHSFLLSFVVLASAMAGPLVADRPWQAVEKRSERHEITFTAASSAGRALLVSNICGSVEVTVHSRDSIAVSYQETIHARTDGDLARAKREAFLRIDREADRVALVADGPFRQPNGGVFWSKPRYRVCYDMEIQVPRRIDLDVSTVNDGAVVIRGTEGELIAENVNGPLSVFDVTGNGSLSNVNGDIRLTARQVPTEGWTIETINGDVDARFPDILEADLRFETMHGEILTAFPVTTLPRPVVRGKRDEDGLFTYQQEPAVYARIGAGGPHIAIETINGDIVLRRNTDATR